MTAAPEKDRSGATRWIYHGVWSALVHLFRVPDQPPTLPRSGATGVRSFQPSAGFLKCLKFKFWLVMLLIDGLILATWLAILSENPMVAWILAAPLLILAILPDIVAYIAIHLRYDTTWYVLTDRSLRIRRGIMSISETTVTFENVQNVKVEQGPLQRWFDVADIQIETAGGGGGGAGAKGGAGGGHQARIEGVSDAAAIRELIIERARASNSAGLGDEVSESTSKAGPWSAQSLDLLREIRDLAIRARSA